MKKYLLIISFVSFIVISCSDDDKLPSIRPSATGEFVDERNGMTYTWVRIGSLEWMTSNLKYGTPYYERTYSGVAITPKDWYVDTELDFQENGNLYEWEEIDTIAPAGWRVATDEDWKNLEMALGMSEKEADMEGWRGENVSILMRQGEEGLGLNLVFSGNAVPEGSYYTMLKNLDKDGYYWTSTEKEDDGLEEVTVYFRRIFKPLTTVYRGTASTEQLMRVRCVRDI